MLNFPEIKKKTRKPAHMKSDAIRELEMIANEEARLKNPLMPHQYLAPRRYSDKTANELTRCIVDYIRFRGGFASRINSQGQYRNGRYTYSPVRRGIADIMATYKGRSLHVEVKIGRDRQSEAQKQIQAEVEASGGLYFIAKDFESFKIFFDQLKNE